MLSKLSSKCSVNKLLGLSNYLTVALMLLSVFCKSILVILVISDFLIILNLAMVILQLKA